jgi:hypothetical protein
VNIVDLGYPVYKPDIRKLYILLKLKLSSPSIGEHSLVLVRYKVYIYEAYKLDSQGQLCSPMLGEEIFSFSKI